MASDQIEYCGDCPYYEECRKRAEEGTLEKCKIQQSSGLE